MAKSTTARISSAGLKRRIEALSSELAEARGELDEVRRQQSATAGILQAISGAPGELQPLLDSIVETAGRLCDAYDGIIMLRDGAGLRIAAHHGPIPIDIGQRPLVRAMATGRAVIDRKPVHIHDVLTSGDEFPLGREFALKYGFRTVLAIPLLREGQAVGSLTLRRAEARPFSDKHIALLKTFADQAVVAIENARLFEEVQARTQEVTEALESQTATSEVLDVISRSPAQLQPVFDAIAHSGARLCKAQICNVFRFDGGRLYFVASHGLPARGIEIVRRHYPKAPERTSAAGRALLTGMVAEIPDTEADPDYQREFAVAGMFRGAVAVPMLKDGRPVGAIAVMRSQPGRFPERQIALLRTFADQAVIAIENTRLFEEVQARNRDLTEALEQQTATSEILRIISTSPTDLDPVLKAVAQNAARLCAAEDAHIWQRDGGELRLAASWGLYPSIRRVITVSRQSVVGRAVHDQVPVHVEDLAESVDTEFPDSRAMKEGGNRTILAIPLPGKGEAMGAIMIRRREVRPFSDAQIALLRTFADQAVIAIENTRLFEEVQTRNRDLTESLEVQTATSEVLNVISRSPTDVRPVFETIAANAVRLCGARMGAVYEFDGELVHLAAHTNYPPEVLEVLQRVYPRPPQPDQVSGRAILARDIVQIADSQADPLYKHEVAVAGGWRSQLGVPMLRHGLPIGAIVIARTETGAFADRHIELLRTFADQAVIAIENARLFAEVQARTREVTEALEYQTATSEVLDVISRSPTDAQPVFEAIAQSTGRLCQARHCNVFRYDGEFMHLMATYGMSPEAKEALAGGFPAVPGRESTAGRAILGGGVVQIADLNADPHYRFIRFAEIMSARSSAAVPLVRDGRPVGAIAIARSEVGPFPERQIELLRTFANQAVIAIENARLFEEVQARTRELIEALESQTATSDVLEVISRSPAKVQPVFDAIARSAARLCDANFCHVFQYDGELIHFAASHGLSFDAAEAMRTKYPMPAGRATAAARAIISGDIEEIPDVHADPEYEHGDIARIVNYRGIVAVPMLRNGRPAGAIAVARSQTGRLPQRLIELLKTFADQAVIAVENARLFEEVQARTRELTESLEYQTATSDVLNVISRSPTDAQPVFDAIAQSAMRLCDTQFAAVFRFDSKLLHLAAVHGGTPHGVQAMRSSFPIVPHRGSAAGRALLDGGIVHIPDTKADPEYTLAAVGDAFRSTMAVPMVRNGVAIGTINLARYEPGHFSERQIALLRVFADQAVIAVENARLFEEVQARTREVTESLEYQTATSDVLNVISRSPTDAQPVFDAIAQSTARLCKAQYCNVFRYDGKLIHFMACHGMSPEGTEALASGFPVPAGRGSAVGRSILNGGVEQIIDINADPEYTLLQFAEIMSAQSTVAVPMLRHGHPIGAIAIGRSEPGPFPASQIELLQTFADQAVIAINNVALFEEVQARTREVTEALEYQTATSDVLNVISRSPTDAQPVFDSIAQSTARLCQAEFCAVLRFDGELIHFAAENGMSPEGAEALRRSYPMAPGRGSAAARSILSCAVEEVPDVYADPEYAHSGQAEVAGFRSVVAVPMLKDGRPVGAIALRRSQAGRFPERQIELLRTFANQAVIAIENARLFEEVQARTRELTEALEYQTATSDVLNVISRSPNELQPVLDAMLRTAGRLCEAEYALFFKLEQDGKYHVAGSNNASAAYVRHASENPLSPGRGSLVGRTALERRTVHLPDCLADPEFTALDFQRIGQHRTMLGVPLLRDDVPIGVIGLLRNIVRPYTEKQIELVRTFADQAVIAIENARLFEEVQARTRELSQTVGELKALSEVGQTISSTLELKAVLNAILAHACRIADSGGGAIYVFDPARGEFDLEAGYNMRDDMIGAVRARPIRLGEALVGHCAERREAVQIEDLTKADPHPLFELHLKAGVRALLAVPLLHQNQIVGALVVRRKRTGAFAPETIALLQSFAAQSAIAIQNARLFHEIEQKSRALEEASRHKSQFVANMSHELRTPLAAMLGYAELLREGIYGVMPEKALPVMARIESNGRHLLGLINTVLDISKIESGQFKLNLGDYAMASVVESVRAATESLAAGKKLAFRTEVTPGLPPGLGDEQRLTQVLLNLVGNAIKFTDTGEVCVNASVANGRFTVAVSDTGPGIPATELERVFEQFHQVDNSNTKAKGGTGLGLAISKQIVEMHGGRIWVESSPGQGSIFRMELPVRAAVTGAAA